MILITENLSTLKIHKLTQDQYDRELAAGRIDEHALYLTPDDGSVIESGAVKSVNNTLPDERGNVQIPLGQSLTVFYVQHNDIDSFTCDMTYGEIREAIVEDMPVLGIFINTETGVVEHLHPELCDEDGEILFHAAHGDYICMSGGWAYYQLISSDGVFYVNAVKKESPDNSDTEWYCTIDKTENEIRSAYNAGLNVCCRLQVSSNHNLIMPLSYCNNNSVFFSTFTGHSIVGNSGNFLCEFVVMSDTLCIVSFYDVKQNAALPEVTSADNGKVLMVVNGKWTAVNLNLTVDENGVVSV